MCLPISVVRTHAESTLKRPFTGVIIGPICAALNDYIHAKAFGGSVKNLIDTNPVPIISAATDYCACHRAAAHKYARDALRSRVAVAVGAYMIGRQNGQYVASPVSPAQYIVSAPAP